jgi:hypothetical protein
MSSRMPRAWERWTSLQPHLGHRSGLSEYTVDTILLGEHIDNLAAKI